jgi:hypothetical protein
MKLKATIAAMMLCSVAHADVIQNSEVATLFVTRQAPAGGQAGWVNSAMRGYTQTQQGTTSFEWAVLGIVDNYATGGENVGVYGQGNKYQGAGPTWGGVFEARDKSGTATPSALVGLEVDNFANGVDQFGNKVGVDIVIGKGVASGAPNDAGIGLRIGNQNGDATQGSVFVGVDMSQAVIRDAAIAMPPGVPIKFGQNTLTIDADGMLIFNGQTIDLVKLAKRTGALKRK